MVNLATYKITPFLVFSANAIKENALTVNLIDSEISKAEKFRPELTEYIIATTSLRDTIIQEHIRNLNTKRKEQGLFQVLVYFWEDITDDLTSPDNHDLLRKYYPQWAQIFPHSITVESALFYSTKYAEFVSRLIIMGILLHMENTGGWPEVDSKLNVCDEAAISFSRSRKEIYATTIFVGEFVFPDKENDHKLSHILGASMASDKFTKTTIKCIKEITEKFKIQIIQCNLRGAIDELSNTIAKEFEQSIRHPAKTLANTW